MNITRVQTNMTRESVLAFYELKLKHKERSAYVIGYLVTFGIFVLLPFLMAEMFLEATRQIDNSSGLIEIIIVLGLIIVILAICFTTNAYRCGRLFHSLRKNRSLDEALLYIEQTDGDYTQFHIVYIMTFYNYQHSYITKDGLLVVVYNDGQSEECYSTYDYEKLCDNNCENAVLLINEKGVKIVSGKE